MKKVFLVITLICCGAFSAMQVQAQKYGHVNSGEILKVMPGVDSISIKLQLFQTELQEIYQGYVAEYQAKMTKFDQEAGTMSASIRQIREKELTDLQNRIREFEYGAQEDIEEKQFELAKPFQDKIQNAINAVAQEEKFSYIFDTQILLYFDGGIDATPLVKKKLGIK